MVIKKEIFSKVTPEVAAKLPSLVVHYGAPNLSRLIEEMINVFIEEMETEKHVEISDSHVQSIR